MSVTQAVGGPVEVATDTPEPLEILHVEREGGSGVVHIEREDYPLGLTTAAWVEVGQAFARELHTLTTTMRSQEAAGAVPSLDVPADRSRRLLRRLRDIGVSLHGQLSAEVRELIDPADRPRGPQIVVLRQPHLPPLRWEFLYNSDTPEKPSEVSWEKFWGFRLPITHWTSRKRKRRIRATGGLSVACESLRHSGGEVDQVWRVVRRRQEGFSHHSLAQLLADRMCGGGGGPPATGERLAHHLRGMSADRREEDVADHIHDILSGGGWEWYHFACHCDSEGTAQALAALQFDIAGCTVRMPVAQLPQRATTRPVEFVFLNACGTAAQASAHQSPGFPRAWIDKQNAGAVLATVCPVPDAFAHQFALAFYGYLFGSAPDGTPTAPLPLASALVAARRHFMREFNNPLGLAYTLYADAGTDLDRGAWA